MNDWVKVKDKLPNVHAGKFRVRRENGIEMDAFFYADKMMWTSFYGKKTSHWWDAKHDHDRLDDVTHWLNKEDKNG